MNRKRIEEIITRQNEIHNRNYYAYQETGISRYKYAADKADEIAEIASLALSSVDDHEKMVTYRVLIQDLAYKADQVIQFGRDDLVSEILSNLIAARGI